MAALGREDSGGGGGGVEHPAPYNIVPSTAAELHSCSDTSLSECPELQAAIAALSGAGMRLWRSLRRSGLASRLQLDPWSANPAETPDAFHCLQRIFSFQEGNVRNQREHLVLQLMNTQMRMGPNSTTHHKLDADTVHSVCAPFLSNYNSYCRYLGIQPYAAPQKPLRKRKDMSEAEVERQREEEAEEQLCYTCLSLLVWGEAANLRFMPECLCYIFHHVAEELSHVLRESDHLAQAPERVFHIPPGPNSFLTTVVTPFYTIAKAEAPKPKEDPKPHNSWRNYDDLNEYFWSKRSFSEVGWPPQQSSAYFVPQAAKGKHVGKQGFVEQRTILNLLSGFDRVWIILLVGLQVLVLAAWASEDSGSTVAPWTALASSQDAVASLLSCFLTWAVLDLLIALVDIMLQWRLLRPSHWSLALRFIIRSVLAGAWIGILSVIYGMMWARRKADQGWSSSAQSLFHSMLLASAVFLLPQALSLLMFLLPTISRALESSNIPLIRTLASGLQGPRYVGRGMRETLPNSIMYAAFWILLLALKFVFSYEFQVLPLVEPTKILLNGAFVYMLPAASDFYRYVGIISLWTPVIVVYLMDVLIWYSVLSAVVGYLVGVFQHIGEINNLKILVHRFRFLPRALRLTIIPRAHQHESKRGLLGTVLSRKTQTGMTRFFERVGMQYGLLSVETQEATDKRWVIPWNEMIKSFREEDLISNSEVSMLVVPDPTEKVSEHSNWPAFLLSDEVTKAVGICRSWHGSSLSLWRRLSENEFRRAAILECYDLLRFLLLGLLKEHSDEKRMVTAMLADVDDAARHAIGKGGGDSQNSQDQNSQGGARLGIPRRDFRTHFQLNSCTRPLLSAVSALAKFLATGPSADRKEDTLTVVLLVQKLHEVLVRDVWEAEAVVELQDRRLIPSSSSSTPLYLDAVSIPSAANHGFYGAASRLHFILSSQNALATIPHNLAARRRITFFCNSLFMNMPAPVPVRQMLPFCVLTPYFKEPVEYSVDELRRLNEDGVSTLVYLQSVYPDEWRNLEERVGYRGSALWDVDEGRAVTEWASNRGQTLARTVRGMCYYHRALKLLHSMDSDDTAAAAAAAANGATADGADGGGGENPLKRDGLQEQEMHQHRNGGPHSATNGNTTGVRTKNGGAGRLEGGEMVASIKFTYVVSCQVFGEQLKQNTPEAQSIIRLMSENPSLRIAYVDTCAQPQPSSAVGGGGTAGGILMTGSGAGEEVPPSVYSVLVKWDETAGGVREVYRVLLPGPILIGEGKPENQNHAIIFTRGDALQAIDMNQDGYLEEALKMRNFLEEMNGATSAGASGVPAGSSLSLKRQKQKRRILGMREHVFTGAVSSLASFMSAQETAFVTLGQRVLATPLKVRMHYGHPDVFDRVWSIARGGVSKASKAINVSEDIFAGFNCTLRGGSISHHEYIQVGKGRDVGINQISVFETKVASGNGEQVLSRDVFRLARGLDTFRSLSFYTTSVGFFFCTALVPISTYAFLYGRCFLALSGIESSVATTSWGQALASSINQQLLVQVGVLTAVPMLAEQMLEKGAGTAVWEFVLMLLQLAPVFFSFSLGTRAHYFLRTIMHGGAMYRSTGRGFVVHHESFLKNFRLYSRSHFNKAVEMVLLLICYMIYSGLPTNSPSYWLLMLSSWLLALSWMMAPFIFNPVGFDWLKCGDDWDEWIQWMWRPCGVAVSDEGHSWEAWWRAERAHLSHTGPWGLITEALLSVRWFLFQYTLVYQLKLAKGSTSILVYVYSWLAAFVLVAMYGLYALTASYFSHGKSFTYRSIEVIMVITFGSAIALFLTLTSFSVLDVLSLPLLYLPTGWGILQLCMIAAGAFKSIEKGWVWANFVIPIARLYDILFGSVVFLPLAILSWLPGLQDMQTRVLFNQAFSRNLQITRVLKL